MKIKNKFEFSWGKMRNCLRIFREESSFFLERYSKYSSMNAFIVSCKCCLCEMRETKLKIEESCFCYSWNSAIGIRKSSQVQARACQPRFFSISSRTIVWTVFFACWNCRDAVIRSCRKIDDQFFSILLFSNN